MSIPGGCYISTIMDQVVLDSLRGSPLETLDKAIQLIEDHLVVFHGAGGPYSAAAGEVVWLRQVGSPGISKIDVSSQMWEHWSSSLIHHRLS